MPYILPGNTVRKYGVHHICGPAAPDLFGGERDICTHLICGKEGFILGTPATAATTRYQKKKGLISKSYKLDRETAEALAEACENAETSQAKELTKFMKRYIRKHHPDYE